MDEDFKRSQKITHSSEDGWVEDHITGLNGRGALFYKGGENGRYMRISPEGMLTVGTYEGAYPHIGETIFSPAEQHRFESFDKALETACQLGGADFMTDMITAPTPEQDEPDCGFEMKM